MKFSKFLIVVMLSAMVVPTGVKAKEGRFNLRNHEESEPGREVRANEIEQIRENLQEVRSKVASNHAKRLDRRFSFYYERLSKIIAKLQARIDLLKTGGKDVTLVQSKLDIAKAKLEEAKIKGEEAVAAFKAIDPAKWSEQKTEITAARDLAVSARKLYLETFSLLKAALKELKTISKPALPAASAAVNNSQ